MLAAAVTAFVTVFVAEFGDKSQLVCMTMACRYPPLHVLAGSMTAMALLMGIAVAAGELVAAAIPHTLVAVIAGLFFIVTGIFSYLRHNGESGEASAKDGFFHTTLMIFMAEFGDKTQLATLFLAASLGYPLAVFAGALLAMLLNNLFAVYLGSRFISRINPRYLRIGTSALFILIGLIMIIVESGLIV